MSTAFFKAAIGKPYQLGAAGPEAYDCWGLVRRYYQDTRGVALPVVDAARILEIARAFGASEARNEWREVDAPAEGDAVLMGQARVPHHVGVWIDGGVLHAVEGAGVVYSNPSMLRLSAWNVLGYFRHD